MNKEHKSYILEEGKWATSKDMNHQSLVQKKQVIYVDSDGFFHNLNGYSYFNEHSPFGAYFFYIHGKEYTKEDWDIERNRIKMLDEL